MNNTNKGRFMYLLGGMVIGCAIVIIALLVFFPLPTDNKDVVNIALGTLLGMATTVVTYFFGSSKSSADKTALLNKGNDEGEPTDEK